MATTSTTTILEQNTDRVRSWVSKSSGGILELVLDENGGTWHSIRRVDGKPLRHHESFGEIVPVSGVAFRFYIPESTKIDDRHKQLIREVDDAVLFAAKELDQDPEANGDLGFLVWRNAYYGLGWNR